MEQVIQDMIVKLLNTKDNPGIISARTDEKVFELEISNCEQWACLFHHFSIVSLKEELTLHPNQVEKKITYLSERLKVIEIDKEKTILRSDVPLKSYQGLSYFELEISPYEMTFCRYKYSEKFENRKVGQTVLTKQTIKRLMEDFDSLVSGDKDNAA